MKIWRRLVLVPSLVLTLASPSFGQDVESRLKALEDTTRAQQQKIEEQQRLIDELKSSPPAERTLQAQPGQPHVRCLVNPRKPPPLRKRVRPPS